jgi:hypothetical protein
MPFLGLLLEKYNTICDMGQEEDKVTLKNANLLKK